MTATKEMQKEDLDALIARKVEERLEEALRSMKAPPVALQDDLPERMVRAEQQVREQATIVNHEAYSRTQKRKAIEEELARLDDTKTNPYILYSLETCPHNAPTVGGHEFPRYILKKQGKNKPDVAEKKVAWLTDREAARIRMCAEIKFMRVPVLDDAGKPVLDPRSKQSMQRSAPYKDFIRLLPTATTVANEVISDPGTLVASYQNEIAKLKAEFEAFKLQNPGGGANPFGTVPASEQSAPVAPAGQNLNDVNKELRDFKRNAAAGEREANKRRDGRENNKVE